jgi:SAM-dependent methyltransferase
MVKSISPVPIADPDLPIALRPAHEFPPVRSSVFDDPGDEKSWHASQRSDKLLQHYEGREPSWYASAVAPLAGSERVLDLGCGPGLALQALLEQGSSAVLGVDRWPAFVAGSTPEAPILAHDLTLPMPFLESGSFDGVLSHYALDYVSPICIRQILREAHRVLAPGGRLVVYLAAIGLGGGDESRTVSYSPQAMRTLLAEAGFEQVEADLSPNGRNTKVTGRSADGPPDGLEAQPPGAAATTIEGDTQLSASFSGTGEGLTIELAGRQRGVSISVEQPPPQHADESDLSVCARAQTSAGATMLQLWTWCGRSPVVSECVRLEFAATEMRVEASGGGIRHLDVWKPAELLLEPPGNAYARLEDVSAPDQGSEAEGRQVVVGVAVDSIGASWDRLGKGRNRFLIAQPSADTPSLDREWLAGRIHGIALAAGELGGEERRDLLLWAGWRQCLLYLGGAEWGAIQAAVERRRAEMEGPVVLVDPALASAGPPSPLPDGTATLVSESERFFVLLDPESEKGLGAADLARLSAHLLLGGPQAGREARGDADETLRYLTERTLLMRLRQTSGHGWAEVGRRPEAG